MRILLTLSLFCFLLFACKNKKVKKQDEPVVINETTKVDVPPVQVPKDSILLNLSKKILSAFKSKAYDSLALFIHPDEGLRFSPNAFVDTAGHLKFTATRFKTEAGAKKQRKMTWGEFDGSGEPIEYTIGEYIREFVYDVDFLNPETRKVNEFIGGSTSQNNLLAVYTGCDFTESHFSGFEKKYEGTDWRSLRLVFKQKDGQYYLVGVVHDEWTI
ncbi:MAG: hypothetical protein SGI83_00020 [Bacteroidota bacterium]|nr:hypothetical protein [Bacteroidota bacterium]